MFTGMISKLEKSLDAIEDLGYEKELGFKVRCGSIESHRNVSANQFSRCNTIGEKKFFST